ncbi:uncharacterized protein LOC132120909 [Carassius carassius]|uniref:uncharacterized protein LOC132120909 n=1 Tax=Carassius carassius TaxID=217509 RepID=UPI002868CFA2|nr:uncharacterized protein LOC132120909 [Carassius carassius]
MESCAVMRGSKNGLGKKIRDHRAPQLLDIDGDSCHHLHNSSKKLCCPFERWVESLLSDLHTDHKWSADMKDGLREICSIFGIHFSRPECYIPHRWLSVLDVSLEVLRMWDALVMFYYAFLSNEDKCTYKDIVSAILQKRKVQGTGRARIKELWKELGNRSKNFTNEGKMRKVRICKKVLFEDKKTLLELHFYSAVLPMLKHYVLLFQSKDPKVHKLHDESYQVVKYNLKAMQVSAIQHYSRKTKESPVNVQLCRNVKRSSQRYRALLRDKEELNKRPYHSEKPTAGKKMAKDAIVAAAVSARRKFQKKRVESLKKLVQESYKN